MKVMLGGSRHLSVLPDDVIETIQKWARDRCLFLLGDAKGTDAKFQEYFRNINYPNVKVYYSGEYARHNLGHWLSVRIESGLKAKGHALHGAKDREMARDADVALMVWDALSVGTIANVLDLVNQGKTCFLYVFSDDSNLYKVDNASDIEMWHNRFPEILEQASKRLKSYEKRINKSRNIDTEKLF